MSSPHPAATTSKTIQCVACDTANDPHAKFCAGCGHGLYESCGECGNPVTLQQKFCGSCGKDLAQELATKRAQFDRWMATAVQKAKVHEYDDALALLERIAETTDFRFKFQSDAARQAIDKIQNIAHQNRSGSEGRLASARQAAAAGDHQGVVDALATVPEKMLDDDARRMLAGSRNFVQQVAGLRAELSQTITEKDWATAGHLLGQLLELLPEDPKYLKLSQQAAAKLIKSATRKMARHDYEGAARQLSAVPSFCHNADYLDLAQKVGTIRWLADQFPDEPFATQVLGRLAVRFSKEAPHDGGAAKIISDLSAKVKQRPADPRIASPPFRARSKSWIGGDVALFSRPASIDTSETPAIATRPGRWGVAMGLALQGLGRTRVKELFGSRKGLLSSLAGRNKTKAWGIDVGTSGIHAVLMRQDKSDERPVVLETYTSTFDSPVNRVGNDGQEALLIKSAIESMLAQIEIGDAAVISNFCSSSVVSRFLRLPPVKDKQVGKLVETEAQRQIPIPLSELHLVTWTAPLGEDQSKGRPTLIAAAKKTLVQSRIDVLQSGGLSVDGLQNESIALVNFAWHEFTDVWQQDEIKKAGSPKLPTVALIDAGATSTRLALVSDESCWYWTIDSGSEELTSVVARITRKTKEEAEKLKFNPAALDRPADMYEPVEDKLTILRGRMEKIAQEGSAQDGRFHVVAVWCFGGGSLAHAWIRRVMLEKK